MAIPQLLPPQSLDGEWFTATYPFSSPNLRRVRIMMRNRFSDGHKRARRAKLNYLLHLRPELYYVDQNTKEASERLAEKVARRAIQRSGQTYRRIRPGALKAAADALIKEKRAQQAAEAAAAATSAAAPSDAATKLNK